MLHDYIACGIEPAARQAGGTLAFRREVETHIYNTLPHHLGRAAAAPPAALPGGLHRRHASVEIRQVGLAATRALAHGRVSWIEGSHLFPMEQPADTAAAVLRALA